MSWIPSDIDRANKASERQTAAQERIATALERLADQYAFARRLVDKVEQVVSTPGRVHTYTAATLPPLSKLPDGVIMVSDVRNVEIADVGAVDEHGILWRGGRLQRATFDASAASVAATGKPMDAASLALAKSVQAWVDREASTGDLGPHNALDDMIKSATLAETVEWIASHAERYGFKRDDA